MKDFDEKKVIHLMKGKSKYITIMPYAEFKKLKKSIDKLSSELNKQTEEKKDEYDLRFKEEILKQILDFYKGDLKKLNCFVSEVCKLKSEPFPDESKQISSDIFKILISNLFVFYGVNKSKRLITVFSVEYSE